MKIKLVILALLAGTLANMVLGTTHLPMWRGLLGSALMLIAGGLMYKLMED